MQVPRSEQNRLERLGIQQLEIELQRVQKQLRGITAKTRVKFIRALIDQKSSEAVKNAQFDVQKMEEMQRQCMEWNDALDAALATYGNNEDARHEEIVRFLEYFHSRRVWKYIDTQAMQNDPYGFAAANQGFSYFEKANDPKGVIGEKLDTILSNSIKIKGMGNDGKEVTPYCIALFTNADITKQWQAPMLAKNMVGSAFGSGRINFNPTPGVEGKKDSLHGAALEMRVTHVALGKDVLERLPAITREVSEALNLSSVVDVLRVIMDPSKRATIERMFDAHIEMAPPRSPQEAHLRWETYMHTLLLHGYLFWNEPLKDEGFFELSNDMKTEFTLSRMGRIPLRTHIDAQNIPHHLAHIDASVFATPELITATENGNYIFLIKKETFDAALASSPLSFGLTGDPLVTRERLAALLPDEPHDEEAGKEWVSGVVPSEMEIARTKLIQEFRKLDEKCTIMGIENSPYQQGWSLLRSAFDSIEWKNSINERENDGEHVQCIHNADILSLWAAPQDRNVLFFSGQNASATWNLFDFLIKFNDVLKKKNAIDSQTNLINYHLLHVMLLGNKYFDAQIDVRKNCQPAELSFDSLKEQPHRYLSAEQRFSRMVTRAWPLSTQEAYVRIGRLMHSRPSSAECNWEELMRVMSEAAKIKLEMAPIAIADQEHAWLREHLEMLDPALLEPNPNVTYTLPWGASKAQFVCRKEHLPQQFTNYVSADNEDTLDLVVNLHLQNEDVLETDAWVSGTLPSIKELEHELFTQDFVAEKFFPNTKDDAIVTTPEESLPASDSDREPYVEPKPIPRTKQLRNVLLKNRWKATFTIDDRAFAPASAEYASAEPGHYVLVCLPEAKLQVLISDDHAKGTFVLRNLIDPKQFTKIGIDELLATYGATRVKFDSIQQFRDALEKEISEQINDPMTIYPVASSYPTPLDTFPNDEAIQLLTRDLTIAATMAGKSIHELTTSDFTRIKSSKVRWSFGGVAGGAAYLDRLATEFGLDASAINKKSHSESAPTEEPLEQHELRETILRLLLHEISPEYRKERDAYYKERIDRGRHPSRNLSKKRVRSSEIETSTDML